MTPTAEEHLRLAVKETRARWGRARANRYSNDFLDGLDHLAENHRRLRTAHREAMGEGTVFHLHLMEHRYTQTDVEQRRSALQTLRTVAAVLELRQLDQNAEPMSC
jgi:plasmid stabilization system protein ParE